MERNNNVFAELRILFDSIGVACATDAALSEYCTFRIGGTAALMVFPANIGQLTAVLNGLRGKDMRWTVIGYGSNLLFDDAGYDGVVVVTTGMRRVSVADGRLFAECGASCSAMALAAERAGLSGLEFAYGIPGTCGGAVFMNAGAYGSEMSELAPVVSCFDMRTGETLELCGDALRMSYRHSVFMEDSKLVVLGATLSLTSGNARDIRAAMEQNRASRREKQPLEYPSAGSVFKRHEGYFMGKLIEECELKGCRIGGAQVSEKHAGFIVNRGEASSADVLMLISHIQKVISEKYGFVPECEIRYIH